MANGRARVIAQFYGESKGAIFGQGMQTRTTSGQSAHGCTHLLFQIDTGQDSDSFAIVGGT